MRPGTSRTKKNQDLDWRYSQRKSVRDTHKMKDTQKTSQAGLGKKKEEPEPRNPRKTRKCQKMPGFQKSPAKETG